jgi:hypothetical protein
MQHDFDCPVCKAKDWHTGRTYTYKRNCGSAGALSGNTFLTLRMTVLSEIWFPDHPEPKLTSRCCRTCGFMCYSPRPEEADLEAKYRFLSTRERTGSLMVESPREIRLDRKRAQYLFASLSRHHNSVPASVLDVGGGDGHLLRSFLAAGSQCYVLDYNQHPIAGVTRLGATPADLEGGRTFAAIVCSHVLEHVASPADFLLRLRAALLPTGLLYVEVPFEIWRDIPIQLDPVTHVNFFTRESLATILEMNGFRILELQYTLAPYGELYKRVVVAVATPSDIRKPVVRVPRALELLSPGPMTRANRFLGNCWLRGVLNLPLRLRSSGRVLSRAAQ